MGHLRYLITGGAGFIGSHLVETLLEQGHAVTVIDDLSTGRFENIAPFVKHPHFRFSIDTITNEIVMDRLASEADIIIHLAAAVGVKLIVERPVHTIETNIVGTEHVLRAALRYRTKVIVASTSEVYGKGSSIPFRESDDVVLGPTSKSRWAYAASKMVDEFLALAYHREYGLPVVIVRFFNTVGPRQTGQYGMVVPRFVGQAMHGDPLTIYGDGTQQRCFCDVRDSIRALNSLVEHPEAVGQVFNVGGGEEISIQQLAERIISLTNSTSSITYTPYEEAYAPGFEDMQRRVPDTSRIAALTGWQPLISLDETIKAVHAELQTRSTEPSSVTDEDQNGVIAHTY